MMPTKTIQLTDAQASHVEQVVRSGRYRDANEYVGDLLRRDREGSETESVLADLIQSGIDSGEPLEMTPEQIGGRMHKAAKEGASESGANHA